MLRGLPASSSSWPLAREIVRAAVAGGVERAITTHRGAIRSIAVARDGRIAAASADRTIQVHDLAGATRRFDNIDAAQIAWFDDRRLAYRTYVYSTAKPTELGILDVTTGERRVLSTAVFTDVAMCEGRVVGLGPTGAVTMFSPDAGPLALADSGVAAIDARDGRVAMLGMDHLAVIDTDGTRRERAIANSMAIYRVRLAPGGDRAAALVFGSVLEWSIQGDAPPSAWPRSKGATNGLGYAGETLYAWSTDGSGLVALAGATATPRWQPRDTVLELAPFRDGAMVATIEGRFAYVDAFGVVELAHRNLQLATIACDREGTHLVAGTPLGEIIIIDLAPVRPQRLDPGTGTELQAATAERLIIADSHTEPYSPSGSTSFDLIDVATTRRISLGAIGFAARAWVRDDSIVAAAKGSDHRLVVWDLAGRERFRSEDALNTVAGTGLAGATSVFYSTATGDVMEYVLGGGHAPRRLARFEIRKSFATPGTSIAGLSLLEAGLLVTLLTNSPTGLLSRRDVLFDHDGQHTLGIAVPGWVQLAGRAPDGAWWAVVDFEHVWRAESLGVARAIPFDEPIHRLWIHGDQISALGANRLYQLAPDGTVLRTVSLSGGDPRTILDAVVQQRADHLVITTPAANVQRVYALPLGARNFVASQDGRLVAALVEPTHGPPVIMAWHDPVPVDPHDLPAYLERLTNARLDLGSDTVTWSAAADLLR